MSARYCRREWGRGREWDVSEFGNGKVYAYTMVDTQIFYSRANPGNIQLVLLYNIMSVNAPDNEQGLGNVVVSRSL